MHRRRLNIFARPPQASSSSTQTSTAEKLALTLAIADSPTWLQDNRHIIRGYLPEDPDYLGVVASLTFLHNQTCNVYTHLLGALALPPLALALAAYVSLTPQRFEYHVTTADYFVFGVFFAAAEFCLVASTGFHLLMNQSELGHDFWLRLDLLGIVIVTVGSFVPGLWFGFYCDKWALVLHFALILTSGSANAAFLCVPMFRTYAWRHVRVGAHVALGLSGFIPLLHGTYRYGLEHMIVYSGMPWYLMEAVFYITGVVLYVTRFPERLAPGNFDIWGASHQLFHVCILIALWCHGTGLIQAFSANHNIDMCAVKSNVLAR